MSMSPIPSSLLDYANQIEKKYNIDSEIVKDILSNLPSLKIGFELAFIVEKKLGLNSGYFNVAYRKGYEIKADMYKEHDHLYVKLNDDVKKLLDANYICCKISKGEEQEFDYVIALTKNTLLGFYK